MRPRLRSAILKNIVLCSNCTKQIEYDKKHGVTEEEVIAVMQRIRNDDSFSELRKNPDSVQRLDELEKQLTSPKKIGW